MRRVGVCRKDASGSYKETAEGSGAAVFVDLVHCRGVVRQ